MTSRRRRPRARPGTRTRTRTRTSLTAVLVALAIALATVALRSGWSTHPDADAAPAPSNATTVTTEPDAPGSTRASRPAAPAATAPGQTASAPTDADADTGADSATAAAAAARAALATLPVKGRAPATGYERVEDFGTAWLDVDRNGCDTRNDVLARDLTAITRTGPCTVLRGTLVSPYTGATIDFVRGNTTSTLVQIDHVVALENAWRTGAQQLTQTRREALANDPDNLFAVDGHSNSQKRSGDAATWLPAAKSFRCTYVEHQVTVKARYGLWVVPAERDAMSRVLSGC